MRFRTLAAVLTFVFLTPAAAFAFAFSRTLCPADAGTAVANLQQFLIDDGDGTLTRVAVIHFQTEQGLTPIDCTGPLARAHQRDRGAASRVRRPSRTTRARLLKVAHTYMY